LTVTMLMFMTDIQKYIEKGTNFGSKIPEEIAAGFREQARQRHQHVKYNLAAAAKLWLELPLEIQARMLDQSLEAGNLRAMVEKIIDEILTARGLKNLKGKKSKKTG